MSLPRAEEPIYKTLYGLNFLKRQINFSPKGLRKKNINSFLTQYNKAIEEAKDYKSKAPKTASTKDKWKAVHHAGVSGALVGVGNYTNPKTYITQSEFDEVIKELTACKKFLENELKHLEFAYENGKVLYESLFNFEFE